VDVVAGVAQLMADTVTRIASGVYRVEHDGRVDTVYVAVAGGDWWAFSKGVTYRGSSAATRRPARQRSHGEGAQALTSPMPATVIKVLVGPGASVKKGDTVVILEAMKMELPIRSPSDATVTAVHCRERDLVAPDAVLVELE
jgi:acetyl/propionyl-CoA carboxylase alpha subunit